MKRKRKSSKMPSPRSEDAKQRRKYKKGGRIEAYTFGDALKHKNWP